jgi:UDP-glucose 4-epimerase
MKLDGIARVKVLLTGGAGYLGAHVAVEFLSDGFDVVILDNFSNAHPEAIRRINRLGGGRMAAVVKGDIRDARLLSRVFTEHRIDAVVHLAGLKGVAEAVVHPEHYYDVNVGGAARLLAAMLEHGVSCLVFSSSALVYAPPQDGPIAEAHPLRPAGPYGHSKLAVEQLLADAADANPEMQCVALRFFNPVGAHESGTIGQDPSDAPNNLFPMMAETALRRQPRLRVFGTDYPTRDGTCVGDYVHVVDVARGHLAALRAMLGGEIAGGRLLAINLGTGHGTSVLEAIAAFEGAAGQPVRWSAAARRAGDVPARVLDPGRARATLGWRAERDLDAMCRDAWRWRIVNPTGYRGVADAAPGDVRERATARGARWAAAHSG